jgi:hypothetical protein
MRWITHLKSKIVSIDDPFKEIIKMLAHLLCDVSVGNRVFKGQMNARCILYSPPFVKQIFPFENTECKSKLGA